MKISDKSLRVLILILGFIIYSLFFLKGTSDQIGFHFYIRSSFVWLNIWDSLWLGVPYSLVYIIWFILSIIYFYLIWRVRIKLAKFIKTFLKNI
jgi:hypothetical protein